MSIKGVICLVYFYFFNSLSKRKYIFLILTNNIDPDQTLRFANVFSLDTRDKW